MKQEIPKQLVQSTAAALKMLRLYPLRHPAIQEQLQSLHSGFLDLFPSRKVVKMGLLEGTLFIEDHLFAQGSPAADGIASLLKSARLEGVEFLPGLTLEDLRTFLGLLSGNEAKGEDFADLLAERGAEHIRTVTAAPEEEDDEDRSPRRVYGRALKVVEQIFQDVRLGKPPPSKEAKTVVRSMVRTTLSDPHALFALSMLKDYDNYTFTHSVNVGVIALTLGRACDLSEEQLRTLGLGALLHDLGKLKIDRGIITKPGRLTDEEFALIRQHPLTGARIVEQMEGITPEVIDIVLGHHLRFDGQGYPADAPARPNSEMAQMAALADTYDAITTLRSYQRPLTPRKAVARLRELSGTALNPQLVERFIASLGNYPVGSLVRLESNEIGLVVRVGTRDPDSVRLKILFEQDGTRLDKPDVLELSAKEAGRIVADLDPFLKGVTVTDHFD